MTGQSDEKGVGGSEGDPGHVPVMGGEVVALLEPKAGQVMLDCTVGRGGHAKLIMPRLAPGGRYIGLDVDPANLEFVRESNPNPAVRLDLPQCNFADAAMALEAVGVDRVDLLLADLGFSSNQMSEAGRGLSFAAEGPLDMRLDPTLSVTAADLVNTMSEGQLARVLWEYGEERLSRKIARKIIDRRTEGPIQTTSELAEICRRAYGPGYHRIDAATRTFMALRIAVNDELGKLEALLGLIPRLVRVGGRAAIISFHSLEDRLVKRAFNGLAAEGRAVKLTRKPLTAGDEEMGANPRARSAKLRGIVLSAVS